MTCGTTVSTGLGILLFAFARDTASTSSALKDARKTARPSSDRHISVLFNLVFIAQRV